MTAGEHVRKQASSERRQQEKRTPSPTQRRGGTAPRQSRQRGKNRQMRKWILICRSRAVKRGNGQQCGSAGSLRNRGDTVVPCQRVFPGPCLMLCSAFIKNNLAHTLEERRIGITNEVGNLCDGFVTLFEKLACFFNPHLLQIVTETHSNVLGK